MTKYRFVVIRFIAFSFLYCSLLRPQTTPQPTPIEGTNSVTFDTSNSKYEFYHNNKLVYEYTVLPGNTKNGGSFNTLKAFTEDGDWFLPSNFGGIRAMLGGVETYPWDPGVTFTRISHQVLTGDTVYSYWKMTAHYDSCYYSYKMKLEGRTLIIKVEFDDQSSRGNKAMEFNLDRCENAQNPKPIAVPYLPLFYILLSNNIFTSFFSDWEVSNASTVLHYDGSSYSTASVRFSQVMTYNAKTNDERNKLIETLYLTTSPNLNDVLPNVPNPVAVYKEESANSIVWDFRYPFNYLISPTSERYMERLYEAGVRNLWVQIHDWQKDQQSTPGWIIGSDDGLPCVTPANEEYGGPVVLNQVISKARNHYNYRIGLHHNYVDYYPNAKCGGDYDYDENDVARNSDGSLIFTWFNQHTRIQSRLLKPSRSEAYLTFWTNDIKGVYNINGCYLDVHSSIQPLANYVDYDSNVPDAGKYRETMNRYRALYPILRNIIGGPVQGEGGNQIFYQGYVDDIEARLILPSGHEPGYNFPLLLDFDLLKLRTKTLVHGVGYYPIWMGEGNQAPNWHQVLSYIATEIAYGHGSYLPDDMHTNGNLDEYIRHAQTEYYHVFEIQQYLNHATPISILYGDSLQTASDYIKSHPNFADIKDDDFMGKVKVTYDNGIIIFVNRHPAQSWNITVGTPNKWFSYHAILEGTLQLFAGQSNNTNFILPPNNGWVVYNPVRN